MNATQWNLAYFLTFLKRRKWQILLPTIVLLGIAAAGIAMVPSYYRSTATILVEEQEIPSELVRTAIGSYADQRIQVISKRLLATANLRRIIEKFKLLELPAGAVASEKAIDGIRRNFALEMLNADVTDKRSGAKSAVTIAFVLSYEGRSPAQAKEVTDELVQLFLSENERSRQQQTTEAAQLLREEVQRVEAQLEAIEANLAQFKARNADRLPELAQVNMQMRERADVELAEAERQFNALTQRKSDLEIQLAQARTSSYSTALSGDKMVSPREQLKIAQAQYARLSGIYSKDHPDIQRLETEIEGLKLLAGSGAGQHDQAQELARVRAEYKSLTQRYSSDHPDVMKAKAQIAALEGRVNTRPGSSSTPDIDASDPSDNPAVLTLRSQLSVTQSELASVRARQGMLRTKLADYERRLSQTPQAERGYRELNRENEQTMKRYQELKAKLVEAELSQQIEKGNLAEKFTILEPANMPERKSRPNRMALGLLALILALAAGFGYGGVREMLDNTVHNADQLAQISGLPVIGSIPTFPEKLARQQ